MGFFNFLKQILKLPSRSPQDDVFEAHVSEDGPEYAGMRIAQELVGKFKHVSKETMEQFVLEELDAARHGEFNFLKEFLSTCGYDEDEYTGAMKSTQWGNDSELESIQIFFRYFTFKIKDHQLRARLSIAVVDNVMKEYEFGKYGVQSANDFEFEDIMHNKIELIDIVERKTNHVDDIFVTIYKDLDFLVDEDTPYIIFMAYAYARRAAAAGLFLQGIFSRDEYLSVERMFQSYQQLTGSSVEFQDEACRQAVDLLKTYDERLTYEFCGLMVMLAKNENTIEAKSVFGTIPYEHVILLVNSVKKNL